jgi:hypothetical protein
MRPIATHRGTIFDGLLDCYVLDDGRRVLSGRGMVRALTARSAEDGGTVAAESTPLGRFLARLPNGSVLLASSPETEFTLPGGGLAKGREAVWFVDVLRAYDEADDAGGLHHTQAHLARNARRLLRALAGVGIVSLIDNATGYEHAREATELPFIFRALLLDSAQPWDLMWPADFVVAVCKLHGEDYTGGPQPRHLSSTYDRIYRLILGDEVVDELKRRNPEPSFGSNHHQWLTPEARETVRKQIPYITLLAEQSFSKGEFWARLANRYLKAPFQGLLFPRPRKAS